MPRDCDCGQPLEISLYIFAGSRLLKSCASCSRLLGEHVFHEATEFGINHKRPLADETPTLQSHHCRRSYAARIKVGTRPMAEDFVEVLDSFDVQGTCCSAARQMDIPRPAAGDHAIAEYVTDLADSADICECATKQSHRRPAFDPSHTYAVGDKIHHLEHGDGEVETFTPISVVVRFGNKTRYHYKQLALTTNATKSKTQEVA